MLRFLGLRSLLFVLLLCAPALRAATFTVTTTADTNDGACDSHCTLREAIASANTAAGDDTISFASAVRGTIDLASELPALGTNINIVGPGAGLLTVRRQSQAPFRIFTISNGTAQSGLVPLNVKLSGLTISNGAPSFGNFPGLDYMGGGVVVDNCEATIERCVITGNSSNAGGGIYALGYWALKLTLNESTISNNSASNGGAGIYFAGGISDSLTINGSTICNNTTPRDGGGIGFSRGTLTLLNSTISGNVSYMGSGLYREWSIGSDTSPLRISHCTFSENRSPVGSSIFCVGDKLVSVGHTLLKAGGPGANIVASGTPLVSRGYNISDRDDSFLLKATGDLNLTDSRIGPLQNNGGPTPTHALSVDSPAVNAGNPNFAPPPATDQRGAGFPRIAGGRIDIGAYEVAVEPQTTVNTTDDHDDGSCSVEDCTLREAINAANATPNADVITFALPGRSPYTITLNSALPEVQSDVFLKGFATPATLTIQRNSAAADFRLFTIGAGRTVSMEGFTLSGGKADSGGAILNNGNLAMRRCVVKNNSATSDGGALQHAAGTALLEQCSFSGNAAGNDGGAIFAVTAVTLRFCTVNDNQAARYGGGLLVGNGLVYGGALRVCTVSGNRAGVAGGGIYNQSQTSKYFNLRNSTIAFNQAPNGGGLCFAFAGISTMSSLFANNSGGDIKPAASGLAAIYSWGANLLSDNSTTLDRAYGAPHDIYNTAPLLVPLANNGGLTLTHAFHANSPALDKGWRAAERDGTPAETTDQCGTKRPIDFPNVTNAGAYNGTFIEGDGTDIGAFELPLLPTIFINDTSVAEGDNGTKQAEFRVTLNKRFPVDVTAHYATGDGTTSEGDYVPTTGTLTIPANQMSATIRVPVLGDVLDEADEYFGVRLSQPTNGLLSDSQGICTILDDDTTPLSVGDVSIREGDSGTTTANFTITLAAPNPQTVTVKYCTLDGRAKAGSDYEAVAATTLTFAPGETSKQVPIIINGDRLYENDETFSLQIFEATGATIGDERGVGTILDDDAQVRVTNASVVEGNTANPMMIFSITLSAPCSLPITVSYATADNSAKARVGESGGDYLARSGTLTFAPSETSKTVNVPILAERIYENDETFFVNLSNAANASIVRAQGVGTIVNDDALPVVTINGNRILEGNSGTARLVFNLALSSLSEVPCRVQWATQDGTATAGSDYVGVSGAFVNFAPGTRNAQIVVALQGDTQVEANETFKVLLSNPLNCTIGTSEATGTVVNDDAPAEEPSG
jgi:CSLREA domain-containing protein